MSFFFGIVSRSQQMCATKNILKEILLLRMFRKHYGKWNEIPCSSVGNEMEICFIVENVSRSTFRFAQFFLLFLLMNYVEMYMQSCSELFVTLFEICRRWFMVFHCLHSLPYFFEYEENFNFICLDQISFPIISRDDLSSELLFACILSTNTGDWITKMSEFRIWNTSISSKTYG